MVQELNYLKECPSQTAGPYVHIGCTPNFAGISGVYDQDLGSVMVNDETLGERINVTGQIFDGAGKALPDGLVEIWQADAAGLYNSPAETRGTADPNFTSWGRQPTDMETGLYRFETVKPGRVPFADGRLQAPHITFLILARGINLGLNTRLYFADEEAANSEDPILQRFEHPDRINTLMATAENGEYRFDIYLQGENETVFFDI